MENENNVVLNEQEQEVLKKCIYLLENISNVKELKDEALTELLIQAKNNLPVLKKLILPNASDHELNKIYMECLKNKKDKEQPLSFSKEELDTIWMISKSLANVNETYVYKDGNDEKSKHLKRTAYNPNEQLVNTFNVDNKEIGIKNLDFTNIINKHEDKKINEDMALNLFKSMIGSGEIVKIPLYNSGFTVDINSPTLDDVINTQNAISEELTRVGEETINLIFSNPSIVINKHIINLFLKLLNRWTLNVSKEELLNYISIIDLNIITTGILSSMYPRGVDYATNCINSTILEDKKPKCNFKAEGTIDIKKLIWVDHNLIPKEYKYLFARTATASVSVEEVKKYRELIENTEYKNKIFNTENQNLYNFNANYELEFKIPSLTEYINEAQAYLVDLETRATLAFSNSEDNKDANLAFLIALTFVSVYSTFVSKLYKDLPNGDKVCIETRDKLLSALSAISTTGEDPAIVNNAIIDYINSVSISVVGIPNYICPNCKSKQSEEDHRLNQITTVAIDKIFFGLSTLIILKSSRALS